MLATARRALHFHTHGLLSLAEEDAASYPRLCLWGAAGSVMALSAFVGHIQQDVLTARCLQSGGGLDLVWHPVESVLKVLNQRRSRQTLQNHLLAPHFSALIRDSGAFKLLEEIAARDNLDEIKRGMRLSASLIPSWKREGKSDTKTIITLDLLE